MPEEVATTSNTVPEETTSTTTITTSTSTSTTTETTETTQRQEVMPQKQRELYKEIGYKTIKVGETWYPISTKWYKSWTAYTAYNKKDEDIEDGVENLHLRDVPKPGPIDNSELADPEDTTQLKKGLEEHLTHEWLHSSQWKLLKEWYGGGPEFPRLVYERGSTYSREKYINVYPKFLKFVNVNPDGSYDLNNFTITPFPQQYTWQEVLCQFEGIPDFDDIKKPRVHLWLPFEHAKKIYAVSTRKITITMEDFKDEDPKRYVEIPDDQLYYSLNEIVLPKDVPILVERQRDTNTNNQSNNNNKSTENDSDNDENEHRSNGATKNHNQDNADQNTNADTTTDNNTETEKSNSSNGQTAVDSEEQKFPWPLVKGPSKWKNLQAGDILDAKDNQGKWYEAYIRKVGKDEETGDPCVAVHFIGWDEKWDEWVPIGNYERLELRHVHTNGRPHRAQKKSYSGGYSYSSMSSWYGYSHEEGTPEQKGVVGLRNLGQTCFMNSTIQCLAQSPYLTDYFIKGDFVHHINHNNPLGWKGKVAEAWAKLLKDMFSNQYKILAPREFKTAIGEVAPRFMGYEQQDSQELLSFLLDGLHEDLNQIQQKPGTDPVESNGRSDEVVAAEAWRTYLKRNVSIVVDLLQGQYKSHVECPDCEKVSITFDPYMFLSVPLPTERYRIMEFTWVAPNTLPTVYGIQMLKLADVAMLKNSIAKLFNVSKDDLYVADVWKSKIHKMLSNRDMIAETNRRNDDIVVFYSPTPKEITTISNEEKETDKEKETNKEKDKEKSEQTDGNENTSTMNGNQNGHGSNGHNSGGKHNNYDYDDSDTEFYSQDGGRSSGMSRDHQRQPVVPDFKAFPILFQTRVQVRSGYYTSQYREEVELIGMPLLITLSMKRGISHKEARERISELIKPYLTNKKLSTTENESDNNSKPKNENENEKEKEKEKENENEKENEKEKEKENEIPYTFHGVYGYSTAITLEDREDVIVPLRERDFRFILQFQDRSEYNEEVCVRQKRLRHESAPPPLNSNGYDDEDRSTSKPVPLAACLNAFTEEEILDENDAWYCSQCAAFKCAKKKIDLWNSPDLLIIHLKRFLFTREWRDRINTLVQFPLEGLDLSPWMVSEANKQDAIYDLYGISNHIGGMGGGHYTAYAKNLENGKWYELDDSRTHEVHNLESMVSSEAYVLYYKRRKPRQIKHRPSQVIVPAEITPSSAETPQSTQTSGQQSAEVSQSTTGHSTNTAPTETNEASTIQG